VFLKSNKLKEDNNMPINKKTIVMDIDDTICTTYNGDYVNAVPNHDMITKIKLYKDSGFQIVLFTARNMRSFDGDIEKITEHTVPVLEAWLTKYNVQYDQLMIGKPWAKEGFYVDDKAIRPREFVTSTYEELKEICENDKLNF